MRIHHCFSREPNFLTSVLPNRNVLLIYMQSYYKGSTSIALFNFLTCILPNLLIAEPICPTGLPNFVLIFQSLLGHAMSYCFSFFTIRLVLLRVSWTFLTLLSCRLWHALCVIVHGGCQWSHCGWTILFAWSMFSERANIYQLNARILESTHITGVFHHLSNRCCMRKHVAVVHYFL